MSLKRLAAKLAERLTGAHIIHPAELHQLPERLHLRRFFAHFGVDCVFDVGANRGQYAAQLRRDVGYRGWIISYEPNPAAFEILAEAAMADPRWHVRSLALDRLGGRGAFNVMAEDVFSSFHEPRPNQPPALAAKNHVVRQVEVERATLAVELAHWQAELAFTRPFLKLDTQGHDLAIVEGAGPLIENFVGLQSELAIERLYSDTPDFNEALAHYRSLGFRLSAFVPNTAGHFPALIETDCILYRESAVSTR
jgi:FkbM family methyltransferase